MDCVWVTGSSLYAAQLRGSQVQTALCMEGSAVTPCRGLGRKMETEPGPIHHLSFGSE